MSENAPLLEWKPFGNEFFLTVGEGYLQYTIRVYYSPVRFRLWCVSVGSFLGGGYKSPEAAMRYANSLVEDHSDSLLGIYQRGLMDEK